jgi:superfamily II DNA/RNA helicase
LVLREAMPLQVLTIPHTLRQTYTLLNELERIPFLLMFLSLLNKAKSIVFVSTCDEVEYLYFLLTNVSYKDKDGQATEQRLLPAASYTVFKLHGNIE